MENNIAVSAPPSERSLEVARWICDGLEVTDEMPIEVARKIDAELSGERETIIRLRGEVVGLLGVIPTQSFLGKPLDYWVQLGATVERLYDSGKREQRLRLSSEESAKRWLEMLKEIAQIPTGKIPEESIAQAVTRYVGELRGMIDSVRKEFREMCGRNPVEPPCEKYYTSMGERGPCDNCGHPFVVHSEPSLTPEPAPASTETGKLIFGTAAV